MAYDYDFPQSVLDAYDSNSPGDCSKPLGAVCVHALSQHPLQESSLRGLRLDLPECADALGKLNSEIADSEPGVVSIVSKLLLLDPSGVLALLTSYKIPYGRTLRMDLSCGELLALSVAAAKMRLMWSWASFS